jgi:hypothetical protein
MIPARLLRQPISVQRMTVAPDGYGNQIRSVDGSPVTVKGYLDFGSSSEQSTDRDTVTTSWTLFLPATVTISAYDQVSYGDATFQVEGAPQQVWNPRRGLVSHIECRLSEVV